MKKNYKFKIENYNFWLNRLKKKERAVCTNDVYLDLLEEDQIIKRIKKNKTILEVGSGNGILLQRLLKSTKVKKYVGTDFVESLVEKSNRKYSRGKNISFEHFDMTQINKNSFNEKFDYIISKRAIQNVLKSSLQLNTIDNLGFHLKEKGSMILVESSSTAQNNINNFRKKYKLDKIIPPFHNLFFSDEKIKKYNFKNLKLVNIDNFSSNFYFISRIVYALYAKNYLKKIPQYGDYHNTIGLMVNEDLLKIDFSQIKTYVFSRK